RNWKTVHWVREEEEARPLLLNGWILRIFRGIGHPPQYAVVGPDGIQTIPPKVVDELLRRQNLPSKRISVFVDSHYVYLDVSDTWLPSTLYVELSEMSPQHEMLRQESEELFFWQFRIRDWPVVERKLREYSLHAEPTTIQSWKARAASSGPEDLPNMIVSRMLDECYREYLKKEETIHYLRTDFALSGDQAFPSENIAALWNDLTVLARKNPVAERAR